MSERDVLVDMRVRSYDLRITFTDRTEHTYTVESQWVDDGVLRLRCGTVIHSLPLIGIRMWTKELT